MQVGYAGLVWIKLPTGGTVAAVTRYNPDGTTTDLTSVTTTPSANLAKVDCSANAFAAPGQYALLVQAAGSVYLGEVILDVSYVQLADGVLHGGSGAMLQLGSSTSTPALQVASSGGDAVLMQSAGPGVGMHLVGGTNSAGLQIEGGSNGPGCVIQGDTSTGNGHGLLIQSGSVGGHAVALVAAAGNGLLVQSNTSDVVYLQATGGSGSGLRIDSDGAGIHVQGPTGCEIVATSGPALLVQSTGSDAVYLQVPSGSGYGLHIDSANPGIHVQGGTTGCEIIGGSGDALYLEAQTNGVGLNALGAGSGAGISASGGATGHGCDVSSGATSGNGLHVAAPTGTAVNLYGAGGGAALVMATDGGNNAMIITAPAGRAALAVDGDGIGLDIQVNSYAMYLQSTSNDAVVCVGGTGSAGLHLIGAPDTGPGLEVEATAGPTCVGLTGTATSVTLADGAITDAKFTLPSLGVGPATGILGMIQQLWYRFFGRVRQDKKAYKIVVYQADGVTVQTSQTYTSDNGADDVSGAM